MNTVLEEAAWMVFAIISSGVSTLIGTALDVLVPLLRLLEGMGIKL